MTPAAALGPKPWRGILALGLLAFTIIGSYELARPAAESLFLRAHGSERLPLVWLAVAAGAALAVSAYNRFSRRVPLLRLLAWAAALAGALLFVLLGLVRAGVPYATFALYVWKDVYVVVLVEIFWSHANVVFPIRTARWLYGLFCAAGSVGGTVAGLLAGPLAKGAGTEAVLWAVLPLLGLISLGCALGAGRSAAPPPNDAPEARQSFAESLGILRQSHTLLLLLALVATIQLALNLIDFAYNRALEQAFTDLDARTAVIGQVYAATNAAAFLLQVSTGAILRLGGLARVLLFVPLVLGLSLGSGLLFGHFLALAGAKVLSKALDYSLSRAAKEILYIPLAYAEKTAGKALIDILTYRVAKGGASLLLLALVSLGAAKAASWAALGLIGLWAVIAFALGRAHGQAHGRAHTAR